MKKSFLKATTMMAALVLLPFFFQNCAQPFEVASLGVDSLSSVADKVSKTLSWTPPDNESGQIDDSVTTYNVYVGTAAGVYSNPISVPASDDPSLSLNFEKGKTYFIAVSAVNGAGESPKATMTYTVSQ